MSVTGETIYGSLAVNALAWDSTATHTTTNTSAGLVGVVAPDGTLGYEERLAVVRGGLGNGTLWSGIRGDWGATAVPTQTVAATIVGISGTDVGKFSTIRASVSSVPGTLVIRDGLGAIPGTSTYFYGTNTAAFSLMATGSCTTTSSDTTSAAPKLLSLPLGTWSGTGLGAIRMAIAGRGTVTVRSTNTGAVGGAVEAEFRAVYDTTASTWNTPDFTRLSRSGETVVMPVDTTQVTLRVHGATAPPTLNVHAVGAPAATHSWNGLFNLTSLLT